MKALTVWEPWGSLMFGLVSLSPSALEEGFSLPKDVENRSWPTKFRGDLVIHAGQRVDEDGLDLMTPGVMLERRGHFLGVVEVYDCVRDRPGSGSCWDAPGQWHWLLRNPRPFRVAIPGAGKQGLFEAPAAVARAELEEARRLGIPEFFAVQDLLFAAQSDRLGLRVQ